MMSRGGADQPLGEDVVEGGAAVPDCAEEEDLELEAHSGSACMNKLSSFPFLSFPFPFFLFFFPFVSLFSYVEYIFFNAEPKLS
jgi:hypothetical protein